MSPSLKFLTAACVLLGAPAAAQQVSVSHGSVVATVSTLKAGQFVWAPELAPSGPTLLVVNTTIQRAILYRNGVPIAASTVSTGRPGYGTPTGIFTILEKQVQHFSRKYDNAPMPFMQRLTWKGVALHAGNLPGYPASHGCIRLPAKFAKLLFGVTRLGMTVVITDRPSNPRVAPTPEVALRGATAEPMASTMEWRPDASPTGPVSVIVSVADQRAIVLRNGVQIGSAPVRVGGAVTGTFAYSLRAIDAQGQHWLRLQLDGEDKGEPVAKSEWSRFQAPEEFRRAVASIVEPGMTIVVTPDSLKAGSPAMPVMVIEGGREPPDKQD